MTTDSMPLSRAVAALCVATFGGVSGVIAWRSGHLMAQTSQSGHLPLGLTDGDILGAAGVAAVALSAVLLNLACHNWRRSKVRALAGVGLWAVLAAYVMGNAVMFSAHHQAETGGAKQRAADTYADAGTQLALARQKLADLKANPRYAATHGCSDVTAARSRAFCGQVADAEHEIRRALEVKRAGSPAEANSGAQSLAWVTGASVEWIARFWPVFVALVFELANVAGAFAAASAPGRGQVTPAVTVTRVEQAAHTAAEAPAPIRKAPPLIGHDGQAVDYPPKRRVKKPALH